MSGSVATSCQQISRVSQLISICREFLQLVNLPTAQRHTCTSQRMSGDTEKKPLFQDLDPEDEDQAVTEIESLCFNCHEQGMTRLLLTRIPYFKDIIISSFSCDECGFENREAQFGGAFQEKGSRLTVTIKNTKDLNRQVIKSEWCTMCIPSLDFEQPPSKKGEVTTVEGLIDSVKDGLGALQPVRRIQDPETAAKIDDFISRLTSLKEFKEPFDIVLEDPSGNSYIENPFAPKLDDAIKITHFPRTLQHNIELGIAAEDGEDSAVQPAREDAADELKNQEEVLMFQDNCPDCNSPCDTNMKVTDIPFFKQVVIMATVCDSCGFRDTEVKGGSGIADKGTRITLKLTDPSDLSRDVLKSDSCGLKIPELELELVEGTLGGKFTTLEGLLTNIRDQLGRKNPFLTGDSADSDVKEKMDKFCDELQRIISGERLDVTVILDDPAGNSYLQNYYAPDPDPHMTVEHYERDYEQNETLGLNDIKTEGYENS